MPRRYTGDYSRASIKAMEYANTLQGLAVDSIKRMFNSEEEIDLNDVSLAELARARMEANNPTERAKLDTQLAKQLIPILDQVLNPPQEEGDGEQV